MRILSFLRSRSRDSSDSTLARTMALWCSAISICASTDLLSQPLAMLSFYLCRTQMGRTSTVFGTFRCDALNAKKMFEPRSDAQSGALCHAIGMLRCTALMLLGVFSATAQLRPPAVPLVAH